jgi:hypothetical protein
MVSSRLYKFESDQSNFSLTLILNHIDSFETYKSERTIHFQKIIHTVWQAVCIPFDREFTSEQNRINAFKWKSKIDYEKFRIPSVGGHVQTLIKLCVPLFSSVRFRIGAIFSAWMPIIKSYKTTKIRIYEELIFLSFRMVYHLKYIREYLIINIGYLWCQSFHAEVEWFAKSMLHEKHNIVTLK